MRMMVYMYLLRTLISFYDRFINLKIILKQNRI